jgi:SulP family sulfate permease
LGLHLSEVKGPVMDRLKQVEFLRHLTGQVFLTQHQAMLHLSPALTEHATQEENGDRPPAPSEGR